MEFLLSYWYIFVGILAIFTIAAIALYIFIKSPRGEQLEKIRQWLLYAVTEAEKELGSGTGQIKLRFVYDMFLEKFTFFAKFISFDRFSDLVNEALEQMKHLMETNTAVQSYIKANH